MKCRTYWGSHGCDLPEGHRSRWHRCGKHSRMEALPYVRGHFGYAARVQDRTRLGLWSRSDWTTAFGAFLDAAIAEQNAPGAGPPRTR